MENIEEEIWRDILGYEGLYKVSNLGRIKRLPRVVIRLDGRRRTFCESISKGHLHSNGYYVTNLTYVFLALIVVGLVFPLYKALGDISNKDNE